MNNNFTKFIILLLSTLLIIHYVNQNIYALIILYIIGIMTWLTILISEAEYYTKVIWLMFIMFDPLFGLLMYISFGHNYKSKIIYKEKLNYDKIINQYKNKSSKYLIKNIKNTDKNKIIIGDTLDNFILNNHYQILKNIGKEKIYQNFNYELLPSGEIKFKKLKELLQNAKEYIHLEYYIISDSNILNELIEILIQKASQGIEIRILYDAIGGNKLSEYNINKLKNNNIQIECFGKYRLPILNNKINFRNHRKIAIIDGEYAIIGGINISDEYIGYTQKYGHWRDMSIMLEGEVLHELQLTFARDWYFTTKENFIANNEEKYLKTYQINQTEDCIQIINNGADHKKNSTKDVYFKLMATAVKSITIYTPYFVPDYDIINALRTAAENGVEVNIFLPGIGDKKIVHELSRIYYRRLIEVGINVYEMKESFLHAKILMIDDDLSTIGTTNIDYRSFNLNFEITALMISKKLNQELKELTQQSIAISQKIKLRDVKKKKFIDKLIANFVQLFAPFF